MPILAVSNLDLAYGDKAILRGCSLSVEPRERVAIVGPNGTGKSSLLKIMAQVLTPDAGEVSLQRGAQVAYLAQDPPIQHGQTLRQHAAAAFDTLAGLHASLQQVYDRMAGAQGPDLERLLAEQARIESRIQAEGGYAVDHRIDGVLHGLGFDDSQFELPVERLSGGQRARLALARALLTEPDVLLMDEPTNHLDVHGRVWLETFLVESFRGAVVLISHDRAVLTRVAQRIIELERGRIISYPGGYEAFRTLRAERLRTQMDAWQRQQTRFRQEQAFIDRYRAGQRARQAKGRQSRLERARAQSELEPPVEMAVFEPRLPPSPRSGDIVIKATGLAVRHRGESGTRTLFEGLDLTISRGERWGVVGPNGAGKTTLIRCLLGQIEPTEGQVRLGSNVRAGFFSQGRDDMDPDCTAPRWIQRQVAQLAERESGPDAPKPLTEQEARDLAGAFLFSGDQQEAPLGTMSGGERARAALAALLACGRNLLVLDEPTNHLDIPSAERLEALLSRVGQDRKGTYDGTLILVSHDRTLIDAVCDHLIVLDGRGHATVHLGGWSDWTAAQQPQRQPTREPSPAPARPPASTRASQDSDRSRGVSSPAASGGSTPRPRASKSKYSWMPVEALEERIAELEGQIARIDATLEDPDVWKDTTKAAETTARREALKAELDALETEWLSRA